MAELRPGLLRPDAPRGTSFSVSQAPCRAKLDQNESAVDLPPAVKGAVLQALHDSAWNRYPQPARYAEVKERFAAAMGLAPECVVLTVGCDQMILLAFWAAGGPGRRARYFEPTYPMFGHYARLTQTETDAVVLDADFALSDQSLGDAVDLLLLVSPNNPTGAGPERALVEAALARGNLVFVDEAYADFAGASVVDLVAHHPNLLVGRSLSKAQLAGVRLGFGVGHPEVIATLEQLLFAPYHLSALQLLMAEQMDQLRPHLTRHVAAVVAERGRLLRKLTQLGLRVWPSRGNFLLFAVPDAAGTFAHLVEAGVRIRDVSTLPGLDQHLRVTVGAAEENDLFVEALKRCL